MFRDNLRVLSLYLMLSFMQQFIKVNKEQQRGKLPTIKKESIS